MERKTIGIDLGHCETTAAYPRQTQSDRYEVRRLNLMDKDQVISTQIILTDEQMRKLAGHPHPDYDLLQELGDVQIGNNLSAYVSNGEKFSYFKTAPKDFDKCYGSSPSAKRCGITHGMLMACFAFALVNNLLKFNVGDISGLERENLDLLIGCPSTEDWTSQEAQNAYSYLIKTATKVHDVRIIPESRAAMFSSVENEQERISALEGALVFDFGSSTADCTYMLLGRKLLEFSWTLGASEIEREMSRNAYQNAILINGGHFTASTASLTDNEDLLRVAKEEYYSGRYGPKGHPMFCRFENIKDDSMVDVPIQVDKQYMENVVEKNGIQILCDSRIVLRSTWKDLCWGFFREAARRIDNATYCIEEDGKKKQVPCIVKAIVLTGGASKMGFIYEICQEIFPDIHIHRETNPSHTVSNGLAWVAVADENFNTCKEAAQQEIKSIPECSAQTLRSNISDALFAQLVEIATEHTNIWANRPEETLSLRQLQDDLTAYTGTFEAQCKMESICRQQIDRWKSGLSAAMETAVNNQVKRLYSEQVASSLMIPSDVWQELQSGTLSIAQINIGATVSNIDMAGAVRKITASVVGALLLFVAAFAAVASEGLLIPVLGGIGGAGILGSSSDKDLDRPRKKKDRIKAAQKVNTVMQKKKADIMKDFNENLEKQTANYAEIVDNTLTAAFKVVTLQRFEV